MILTIFALAFLGATAASGIRHDGVAHLMIWRAVLDGGDPWWLMEGMVVPLNSYGPLFTVLAPLVLIHPVAPKLLFASSYVLFVVWLTRRSALPRGRTGLPTFALVGYILNPLPWIEVAHFGHFDVLVGIGCVAAVHARVRGRDLLSGSCLGLGILLKYLPILLLPFLVFDRRQFRWRLGLTCAISVLLGLMASAWIWGPSTFRPFAMMTMRGSEMLSIFRFLQGEWSPVGQLLTPAQVDALARWCLAIAGLSIFAWCQVRSVPPAAAAVAALMTTLLFYQVGYIQYQIVLWLVVVYWLWATREQGSLARESSAFVPFAVYFGWLSLIDLLSALVGGYLSPDGRWFWVHDVVGLPTFVLGCWCLTAVIGSQRRDAAFVRAPAPWPERDPA